MSVLSDPSSKRTYMAAPDRRAQILEVARTVFAELGFHVASVADICKAAGIGRGTLYQYFGNKREVLVAVVEDLYARIRATIEARPKVVTLVGVEEATPKLIAAFSARRLRIQLDAVFAHEASLRLVVREARGLDGGIDQIIRRIDEIILGSLIDDLTAARDIGMLDLPEPRLTAQFLLGGVEKMVLTALESDEPVDLDLIVQTAVHLQLFGTLSHRTRKLGEP